MRMKPAAPVVVNVVKNEDKLGALTDFMTAFLADARSHTEITVFARSASSPVAQALCAVGATLAAQQIAVRAIFAHMSPDATGLTWLNADLPFARQVRWADDARLYDGHEQLVLGGKTAWIGDCMRRDPLKRDAFEVFAAACSTTSGHAARSFERLWAVSRPMTLATAAPVPDLLADTVDVDIVPPAGAQDGQALPADVSASTRH